MLLSRVSCTGSCLRELQKFLILILGYAVQCDRKEDHIEAIKSLDVDTQQALVMHIQQVGPYTTSLLLYIDYKGLFSCRPTQEVWSVQ